MLFIALVNHPSIVDLIRSADHLLTNLGLSAPVVMVLVAGLPSTICGLAAGSLFQAGQIGDGQVIFALLMGYFLHIIYEFFADHLPAAMTFFGPK